MVKMITHPRAAVCILFFIEAELIGAEGTGQNPWHAGPIYANMTGTSSNQLNSPSEKSFHLSSNKNSNWAAKKFQHDSHESKPGKNRKKEYEWREYPAEHEAFEWGLPPRLEPQAEAGQCPCIRLQGSASCVAYNSEYQATSLAEAILNFHDLSKAEPQSWDTLNRRLDETDDFGCKDDECRKCAKYLVEHLYYNLIRFGEKNTAFQNTSWSKIDQVGQLYGANKEQIDPSQCQRLQLSVEPKRKTVPQPVLVNDKDMELIAKQIRGEAGPIKDEYSHRGPHQDHKDGWGKKKRQAQPPPSVESSSESMPPEYEFTYRINCINRGERISNELDYVGMCTFCWQWGVLKQEFYPKYINQMTCTGDKKCLSGWGDCRQRSRTIQVLKNTGTQASPKWEPYTLNFPIVCDCQVRSGSALHNLVRQ